jgi:Ni/Co efflux regulator RcnB
MSRASRFALLLPLLLACALPSLAGDGGTSRDGRGGPGHPRANDRFVDVPGWRLPARRVLPPVGYTARPLPGDEPAHGGHRATSSRWISGLRYDDVRLRPTHVVRDPHRIGLRPPPPGHYWRGDGRGNYLLVVAATGIVSGVVQAGG